MNNITGNILSVVFKNNQLKEGVGFNPESNRALDHLDYINRQMTYNDLPVNPKSGSWSSFDYGEYQALSKLFKFGNHDHMMYFVNEVLVQSNRISHHPKLTIDHNEINVELYTKDINDITELDTELSKIIDEIFEDIDYIDTI